MTHSKDHDSQLFHLTKEFMDKLADGSIDMTEAASFLQSGQAALRPSIPAENQLRAWQMFFEDIDCVCDLSGVEIPQHRSGFDRLVVVPQNINLNRVLALMRQRFDVWVNPEFGADLDAMVQNDQRTNTENYAIWARDEVESDTGLKGLSADDIKVQSLQTMSLLERLLFDLLLIHQNQTHLDIIGGTLCSGSQMHNGKVPCVEWSEEDCQVGITLGSPQRQSPLMRARQISG